MSAASASKKIFTSTARAFLSFLDQQFLLADDSYDSIDPQPFDCLAPVIKESMKSAITATDTRYLTGPLTYSIRGFQIFLGPRSEPPKQRANLDGLSRFISQSPDMVVCIHLALKDKSEKTLQEFGAQLYAVREGMGTASSGACTFLSPSRR